MFNHYELPFAIACKNASMAPTFEVLGQAGQNES